MNETGGAWGLACDNSWNGPGASAANTGVSPGPDRSIDLDVTERGLAPAMVEPASTPVIHPERTCIRCFAPMTYEGQTTVLELGVDTQSRKWSCVCGQTCEVQWLVTE